NFRNDLRDHDDRIEAFSNDDGVGDQHGDEDAADDGEYKSEHRQIKRGPQMREQEIMALRHRFEYRRWRRQDDAADAQRPDAELPRQQDERRDEERPTDRGRVFADVIPHGWPRSPCADGEPGD